MKNKGGLVKGRMEVKVRKERIGRSGEEKKKVMVKWIKEAGSDEAFCQVSTERKEGMTRGNTSFFGECVALSPSSQNSPFHPPSYDANHNSQAD